MGLPPITNPQYGRGVFRRRIRLIATAGRVRAAFEDVAHAMRLVLEHDGERITGITPEFRRVPLNVCPGAAGPLRARGHAARDVDTAHARDARSAGTLHTHL